MSPKEQAELHAHLRDQVRSFFQGLEQIATAALAAQLGIRVLESEVESYVPHQVVADEFEVESSTVCGWINKGEIKGCLKSGKVWKVPMSEVEYLRAKRNRKGG